MAEKAKQQLDFFAPNERHGAGLKGADQAAQQAQRRMQERCRDGYPMAQHSPYDFEAESRDYRAMRKVNRRGLRGGTTFHPSDAFGE